MSKFQIITLAIFVVAIVAGVIGFATYKGSSTASQYPPITIWGTFPADTFNAYVANINNSLSNPLQVTYVEKSPDTFEHEFVNALATGHGPDAILISSDMILPNENKIMPIPYSALSERSFMDNYVQEADLYLGANGIWAVPLSIDPLVMYWNRDMFNAAGVSTYPRYWDEFANLNSKLTVRDQNSNIRASAVAMGTLANITNGRELLGSLILQTGNPVTMPDSTGAVVSALSSARGTPTQALDFYSQFADPTSNNYSWNRALPADKVAFLSGTLATYFGFASELADIRAKNPNLNFDVAPLPQVRSGGTASSYARMYGFSVVRASANQNAAYQAIAVMSSAAYLPSLAQVMYLPTVMNALDQNSADPYIENFDKAALISRGWLDADPTESRQVFGDMVDAVVSGQKTADQAIRDGSDAYDVILRQAVQ